MGPKGGFVGLVVGAMIALPGVTPAAQATMPGHNGLVAFDPGARGIATLNPNGNGVAQYLTTGAIDFDPAWTADGKRIFFAREIRRGDQAGYGIFSVRVANKHLHQYTPISWDLVYESPWPLPKRGFVFVRGPLVGPRQVYKQIGKRVTRLTNSTTSNSCPVPSPDGSQIAFVRDGRGLMVMNVDGTSKRVVAPATSRTCIDWSPDGSLVAGTISVPDEEAMMVVLANVTTGQQTVLPETESGETGIGSIAFSPDGTELLVVQYSGYGDWLATYSLQGTGAPPIPYVAQDEATSYFGRAEWQAVKKA
jgi:dipeptidyl aminopeptidase/acylaminoacyl peptidase